MSKGGRATETKTGALGSSERKHGQAEKVAIQGTLGKSFNYAAKPAELASAGYYQGEQKNQSQSV